MIVGVTSIFFSLHQRHHSNPHIYCQHFFEGAVSPPLNSFLFLLRDAQLLLLCTCWHPPPNYSQSTFPTPIKTKKKHFSHFLDTSYSFHYIDTVYHTMSKSVLIGVPTPTIIFSNTCTFLIGHSKDGLPSTQLPKFIPSHNLTPLSISWMSAQIQNRPKSLLHQNFNSKEFLIWYLE